MAVQAAALARLWLPSLLSLVAGVHLHVPVAAGFAADADNFLCNRPFGGGPSAYPLPCTPPASEYTSPKASEFVITAWWPPTISSTDEHADIDQLQEYKAAHFNLVLTGNVVGVCQHFNVTPTPATANEVLECVMGALERIDAVGLQATFTPGHYAAFNDMANSTFGGSASFGGVTTQPQRTGASLLSAPELGWIKKQLEARNLTHVVGAMFLHDDDFTMTADTTHEVSYLHEHWPAAPGLTNGGTSDAGAAALYRSRQFVLSPEEYSVYGQTGNAKAMAMAQMRSFQQNAYLTERYRLRAWPLFALGDGGAIKNIRSDSLVRVQVYSALAFGTQGLDYYCWGHGIWEMAEPSQVAAKGKPSANYPFVVIANADAQKWGTMLIKSRHVGVIYSNQTAMDEVDTSTREEQPLGVAPASNLPVVQADDDLLIGVFSDGSDQTSDTGFLMVVDTRVGISVGIVPNRTAKLILSPKCEATVVPPGVERALESLEASVHGTTISVTLEGGSGALFAVHGTGCGVALRSVQGWKLNPRRISPSDFVGSEVSSSTRNAAELGPPAGPQDRDALIIGGSYRGSRGGCDANIARQLAEAGFVALSVPARSGSDTCALPDLLAHGADYGFAVLAEHVDAPVALATDIIDAVEDFGCHTNFGGQILSSNSNAGTPALAVAADCMRSAMHWGVPLVTNVSSVDSARSLANAGLPLAAVVVPLSTPQHVLNLYDALRTDVGRDGSLAATPAISIPLCSAASDSHVRFAAYLSLTSLWESSTHGEGNGKVRPFGTLWWDGLGTCAPVGSSKFSLVAGINRRITQASWAATILVTNITNVRVWSTSTLHVPGSVKPGSVKDGLVESMDNELLLYEFPPSADGESGSFFVISTELQTELPREVTIVTHPNIKSTTPVEGCAFVGSTACDLHRIGNILPLTLAGGSGQLVTFAAPPAPPPPTPPAPPAPPRPTSPTYTLTLGPCSTSTPNNTWSYNATTGAFQAAWAAGYSAHGQGFALTINCGCFAGEPNPGCGDCPGCANRPGPEPISVTPLDWNLSKPVGACNSNTVWMTSLTPGGPPAELRIIPSITRERPNGKCLTWGNVGQPGIALSSSTCTGDILQQYWALSTSGMLHLGNATSSQCLAARLAGLRSTGRGAR